MNAFCRQTAEAVRLAEFQLVLRKLIYSRRTKFAVSDISEIGYNVLVYQLFIAAITGMLDPQLRRRKPLLAQLFKGFIANALLGISNIGISIKHFFLNLGKAFRVQIFIFDFALIVVSERNAPLKTTVFSFVNVHCVSHFCSLSDAWSDG